MCTDSQAALITMAGGPRTQTTRRGATVWSLLRSITEAGQRVTLQWVPAHCGIPGNERADDLAREAASLPQKVPADTRSMTAATYPAPPPRPGAGHGRTLSSNGSGGIGCRGRSRQGPIGGGGCSSAADRPLESVKAVPTSTGPAATPRRRALGVATRSARRHSSSCAGKRQMCNCAGGHAAPMPVPGRSAPQISYSDPST